MILFIETCQHYIMSFKIQNLDDFASIPSKGESLRGVSCRGRGGVSAGVVVLASLEAEDLDFLFCGTV